MRMIAITAIRPRTPAPILKSFDPTSSMQEFLSMSLRGLPRGRPELSSRAPASVAGDHVLLQGRDRSLVVVLGRDQVPAPEDQGDEDGQRRVVERLTSNSSFHGRPAGVYGRSSAKTTMMKNRIARMFTTCTGCPGSRGRPEVSPARHLQVDRDHVGDVEAHGADPGKREERERDVVLPEQRRHRDDRRDDRDGDHGVERHALVVDAAEDAPAGDGPVAREREPGPRGARQTGRAAEQLADRGDEEHELTPPRSRGPR